MCLLFIKFHLMTFPIYKLRKRIIPWSTRASKIGQPTQTDWPVLRNRSFFIVYLPQIMMESLPRAGLFHAGGSRPQLPCRPGRASPFHSHRFCIRRTAARPADVFCLRRTFPARKPGRYDTAVFSAAHYGVVL